MKIKVLLFFGNDGFFSIKPDYTIKKFNETLNIINTLENTQQ